MDEARPSYYAVIPADVRYDDRIPPNAKLLYGEISALIGAEGYCFASNGYFMTLYGFSDSTVSRLLTELVKAGYIKRELEKDKTGQVVRRKLYLSVSIPQIQPPLNISTTSPQDLGEGGTKNEGDTNLSNTNNIPPNPPEGGAAGRAKKKGGRQCKTQAAVLPERFEKFWNFYRSHVPPDRNAGNRQKAIRAWDKLAPSGELVTVMARSLAAQVKTQAWASGIGVPHASTWLNNRGWEDDWGPAPGSTPAEDEDPNGEEAAEWVS